ncbi:LytTR family two component transcriptional regulator [Herbinix hemicellulosilytica]|uniref:Stage 0 sporulation protein A homolog n=1 Tax=Herbinix hemicellulosilytica TaxID=1564487 RepID=A0A0H5SED8_HERHM|nr:LytTR family DNA-binding domain-containing protein [Herbinix hemicellulosilytica]RBP60078.1 LytTR family two component transcriptional regulator [Herbinix hemicellulosilytica]CRZ33802.1 hypothetical protein HHT355_0597 [Herbinix hemicellulosilytica]
MDNKIKIAVCDDDKFILKIIENKIKEVLREINFNDYDIYLFHKGLDLLKSKLNYNLVLLDIEMADIDGLSMAVRLNALESKPLIIFISAHRDLIELGYHVKAYRFLTKPINDLLFSEAIVNAINEIILIDKLVVVDNDKKILLDLKDVICVEALGEGCCIYTTQNNYIKKEPLKYWLKRLPKKDFIQTHRAYIINLRHIDFIELNQICMKNGIKIPVSVRKRKTLNDILRTYYK